jgi:hypothetical protein
VSTLHVNAWQELVTSVPVAAVLLVLLLVDVVGGTTVTPLSNGYSPITAGPSTCYYLNYQKQHTVYMLKKCATLYDNTHTTLVVAITVTLHYIINDQDDCPVRPLRTGFISLS